jgi:hypothetical protein
MTPKFGGSIGGDGNVSEWFGRIILEAAEACGTKLTEARIRIYAADLADLPADQVIAAFRRVRREGSGFFPSVAEIRRQLMPTPDDEALLAWTSMETAAMKIGAYQSIEFEDAVAAASMLQVFGSWPNWCAQEPGPELALKRQQYLAAYRDLRRQEQASEILNVEPTRLRGLLEGGAGRYERRERLAVGRVSLRGDVRAAFENEIGRIEGNTQRQLSSGTQEERQQHGKGKDGGPSGHEIKKQRMKLTEEEVEAKGEVRDLMHQHNRKHYAFGAIEVTLEPPDGVEKVKVKVKADEDAPPDEDE